MEKRILYSRIGLAALLVIGAAHVAPAATDPARCRLLNRKYGTGQAQLTSIEVSLTLFAAANANCVNLATRLLDQGASVDARDRLGARPLSHAARSGHLEMVNLLLERGAPVDARNLAGSTALYFAAERGHVAVVQRLIDRGADVHLTGRSGASPLAAAAYAGRDVVVKTLLARGADGRKPDDTGKPPIVYAAGAGQFGIVKQLLALDIDVNTRYANDLTLLMWASGPGRVRCGGAGTRNRCVSAGRGREDRRSRCARAHRAHDRGGGQSSRHCQSAAGAWRRSGVDRQNGQTRRRSHSIVFAARGVDAALIALKAPPDNR